MLACSTCSSGDGYRGIYFIIQSNLYALCTFKKHTVVSIRGCIMLWAVGLPKIEFPRMIDLPPQAQSAELPGRAVTRTYASFRQLIHKRRGSKGLVYACPVAPLLLLRQSL